MTGIKRFAGIMAVLLMVMVFPVAVQADGGVGSSPCPGSLPTRLEVGMTGTVAQRYSSLRDVPAGNVLRVMYTGAQFTVVDGPACGASLTHYKLDYGNGVVGWASESQIYSLYGNNQYWLAPSAVTPPATQPDGQGGAMPDMTGTCAGSLPTRLEVGDTGMVARSYSTLRNTPGGTPLQWKLYGAQFTVLEGPVCGGYGDLAWYRVRYADGAQGWSSESQIASEWGRNLYWLAPAS